MRSARASRAANDAIVVGIVRAEIILEFERCHAHGFDARARRTAAGAAALPILIWNTNFISVSSTNL